MTRSPIGRPVARALAILSLAGTTALAAPATVPERGRGLYVWEEGLAMTDGRGRDDPAARRRLLEFCSAMRVLRLYVAVDPSSWSAGDVAELLDGAGARGIVVYAVAPGSLQDAWARPFPTRRRCDHDAVLRWLDGILRFNATAGHPFLGVMLDVEPHEARGRGWLGFRKRAWRDDPSEGLADPRNRRLASEYLEMLARVRDRVQGRLVVAATIPTWYGGAPFRIAVDGRDDVLAAHVARAVDFVAVMNYTDGEGSEARRRVAGAVERALTFGPVESLFETARPRSGGPGEGETLFAAGQKRFVELESMLEKRFGGDGRYVGSALHHYRSSAGAGTRRWPHPGSTGSRSTGPPNASAASR